MVVISLKHLLKGAVSRARISRQVDAVEIVRFVNDALRRFLPTEHAQKAKAVSFKDGIVSIYLLNSSIRHALAVTEQDLLRKLQEAFPEKQFYKFSMRVCKRFPNDDL